MTQVLLLAAATAAVNVASGRWLGRRGGKFWWMQGLAVALRFVVLFAMAQAVWMRRRRAPEVVVFIVTVAVAQLVGQVYLLLRRKGT